MNEIGFVIQQRPSEWIFAQDTPNFAPAPELWRWIHVRFIELQVWGRGQQCVGHTMDNQGDEQHIDEDVWYCWWE